MSLKEFQSLPLEMKIVLSKKRITEFANIVGWDNVIISDSGGKDSSVLRTIARELYDFKSIFADTGLEYPENRELIKSLDNYEIVRPKVPFNKVLEKYGYPIISKEQSRYIRDCQNPTENNVITRRRRLTGIDRNGIQKKSGMISQKWRFLIEAPYKISEQCCDFMKKEPLKRYMKETGTFPLLGTMADESNLREHSYKKHGCIMITDKDKQCRPMMFWTEKDVWEYIKKYNVRISKVYDTGVKRTGCMFCMFGLHMEKRPDRFDRLKISHPREFEYCMEKLGLREIIKHYLGREY